MSAQRLFHITTSTELDAATAGGEYVPAALAREGFIHCSYAHQLEATAARHFAGRAGLVLLEINRDALTCPVVDENLSGGTEPFPHVYGPLPLHAVIAVHPFNGNPPGPAEAARRDS